MISWQLWQSLNRPFVAHPIYQHRITLYLIPPPKPRWEVLLAKIWHYIDNFPLIWLPLLGVICFIIVRLFGPLPLVFIFLALPLLLTVAVPPMMVMMAGTIYGLSCAVLVGDEIARERLQGRWVLMGLTPYGLTGASWALCSVVLQTNRRLQQWRSLLFVLLVIVGALMFLPVIYALLLSILDPLAVFIPGTFGNGVLALLIYALIPFLDYVQSANVGCLVGMLAPLLVTGRANTRGYAVSMFMALQFAAYLVAGFVCLLIIPMLYPYSGLGLALLCLMAFYLIREVISLALWVLLANLMDAEVNELNTISRVNITPPIVKTILKRVTRP